MKNIYCISLGCVRNLVDTEVMIGCLLKEEWTITQDVKEADVILVNTCGFLKEAREEAVEVLQEVINEKKPKAKVVAAGCMVQKFSDELKAQFPDIDFFLGSGDIDQIAKAVCSSEKGEIITDNKSFLETYKTPRLLTTPSHYAYLKVAEGCMKACSYCLIPSIKGFLKSKSEDLILQEFDDLLDEGVVEIILVAQDLGDYGKDRKEKHALYSLIIKMLQRKKHFWLRLLYHYPDDLDDQLIDLMAADHRICPYLDMPIQHIDDDILHAMKRRVSSSTIIKTIEKLKTRVPNFHLRTTLMVGFPGEEEKHFEALLDFVKTTPIDHLGVFAFSPEPGTLAAKMAGQVSEEVKQSRLERLMDLQQDKLSAINESKVGKELDVIIEGYHPESELLLVGRHQGQAPDVDGQVIINDPTGVDEFSKVYRVKITQSAGYDLVGAVVSDDK